MQAIYIRHNAEIAHRLWKGDVGKCLNIHGHSLQIKLRMEGVLDENGMVGGINFTDAKREFRAHIDSNFDHHLLLDKNDPLLHTFTPARPDLIGSLYPGVHLYEDQPTIENLARWIGEWAEINLFKRYVESYHVEIAETNTNGALWKSEDA